MRRHVRGAAVLALGALALLVFAGSALAAPAPSWRVSSVAVPTDFAPGGTGPDRYEVVAANLGGAAMDGSPITITDTLPAGIKVEKLVLELPHGSRGEEAANYAPLICNVDESGPAAIVECEITDPVAGDPATAQPSIAEAASLIPGDSYTLSISVSVPPTASGALENRAEVEGGGAAPASFVSSNEASAAPALSGLSFMRSEITDEAGKPVDQAGGRPFQYTTSFAVNTEPGPPGGAPFVPAGGDVKNIEIPLPPGFVGNPTAIPTCGAAAFNEARGIKYPEGGEAFQNLCPQDTVVGFARVDQEEGETAGLYVPVYNLTPPPGMPAQLGFDVLKAPFLIDTKVRTGSDYGITGFLVNVDQAKRVTASTVTLWGVPGAPGHDALRGECMRENHGNRQGLSAGSCPFEGAVKPFFTMPTSCLGPLKIGFAFTTWTGLKPAPATSEGPAMTGCDAIQFSPTISVVPDTTVTDSPTGLAVDLHVPQHEGPEELATANLRDAVVTLPRGMTVNPSGANGLVGCSTAQFGLTSVIGVSPVATTPDAASCPDASKIGSVVIDTPLLDHPITGSVYVAEQGQNPFGSLLAIYIAADDPVSGVVLKLAGHVEPDPATGQLTATFDNNPQLPFEDLKVSFFDGPRAALRTPTTCGAYATTTSLTPWSAPASGPAATPSSSFTTGTAPGGGACAATEAAQPNQPTFSAGTVSPAAGRSSTFELHLRREDGSQTLRALDVDLPGGLLARLAGIPYCPEPELAAAASRSGRSVQADPPCPGSRLGSVTVGAGAGSAPVSVEGSVYLAGPYKGAPLSLAIVTPAVAGPFDLGTVVVRSALEIDPETAQASVVSDPIPTILQGIPLDVRTISVRIDHPDFTRNPTSCSEKRIGGTAFSLAGDAAALTDRFQATGCRTLGFKPSVQLSLKGSTKHAGHPALKAVVTYPKTSASANIRRAQVNLPHSEFLDQSNLNKICTRPVLLEGKCPRSTIYGNAKAWTPLLEKPLEGPVYLVGGYGYKLPALVAELNGQIRVLLKGKVDSGPNKGIRTTFEAVPDAPVSRFVLEMKGGKKYSLLENSEPLCRKPQWAIARFTSQNGEAEQWKSLVANQCGKKIGRGKG